MRAKTTRTTSVSQSDSIQEPKRSPSILQQWWPLIAICTLLVLAGFAKYIINNTWLLGLSLDLVKAVGVIAVVVYAIHNRLLSLDTSKMAQATIDMHMMERGAVVVNLFESSAKLCDLPRDAQAIVSKIHIQDKKMGKDEFENVASTDCPAIACKITNRTNRCIEASRVSFSVKHTGNPDSELITCDLSNDTTVKAWNDLEIPLVVAPEGELEVILKTFHFLDGGLVQQGIIQSSLFKFDRIRAPKQYKATKNG